MPGSGFRPSSAGISSCSINSASSPPRARRVSQMTVRPLRYLGDPVLRTPCDLVTRFDDSLRRLVTDLLDTVQEPGRAGLAANQIGSSLAVFSYNVDGQLGYVINPEVTEVSGSQEGPEACLSIPGVSAIRPRAARAVVTGVDLAGSRSWALVPGSWPAACSTRPITWAASSTLTGLPVRNAGRCCVSSASVRRLSTARAVPP